MKRFILFFTLVFCALCLFTAAACADKEPAPAWAASIGEETGGDQVALVAGLEGSEGLFCFEERDAEGTWRILVSCPAVIGKNGLGKTQVGDKKTPQGVFTLDCAFGIEKDPGCALPYHQVTEYDYWSGDQYCHYNRMVDIREYPNLNTAACEHLSSMGTVYNYCLNIGYNAEGVPDAGAALFLHCLNPDKDYTAGCVALPEEDMIEVLRHIRENCVIVIDTPEKLTGFSAE